jgi:hypothetical protein
VRCILKVLNSSMQDGISCDLGRRSPACKQDVEYALGMCNTCDIFKANHMCIAFMKMIVHSSPLGTAE